MKIKIIEACEECQQSRSIWLRRKGKSRKFINETIKSHLFNQHGIPQPTRNHVIYPEPNEEGRWLRPIDSPHEPIQWWPKKSSSTVLEPIFIEYAEFPVIDD